MSTSLNPNEPPDVQQVAESATGQRPSVGSVAPGNTQMTRVRRAGRTLMIAGFMLVLLFFSPFVSCNNRTYTGADAFQQSLPTAYIGAKDGIFLIILPIAGAIGAFMGYLTTQQIANGSSLTGLRALGITALVFALFTGCPIGVVYYDIQQARGAWRLEWGYYASVIAALAMLWGSIELIAGTDRKSSA